MKKKGDDNLETSLIINSTDTQGNKVQRTISKVNPEVSSAVATEFAQRVTALSTNTYTGGKRINVADISDSAGAMIAKTAPTLTLGEWSANGTTYTAAITYNGDGTLSTTTGTISNGTLTVNDSDGNFSGTISASEGTTYAAGSLAFNHTKETVTATKLEPTLNVPSSWNTSGKYWTYTYDGDGQILAWGDNGHYSGGGIDSLADVYKGTALRVDTTNKRIYFDYEEIGFDPVTSWGIYVYATDGERYASKGAYFEGSE